MSVDNALERRIVRLNERLKVGELVTSFDLDQVLRNTGDVVLAEYNKRFNDQRKWEDIQQWWQVTRGLWKKE